MRALVTGGSGTIGGAIARALAAAGHHVYVHAHRDVAAAEAVAATIAAAGGTAEIVRFDVTDPAATERRWPACWPPGRCRFWSTMPAFTTMR